MVSVKFSSLYAMPRVFILLLITLIACSEKKSQFVIDDVYRSQFPIKRLAEDRRGYLQLAGLFQLNPASRNTFGSSPENDFVLVIDSLPSTIGSITLLGDSIIFDADENIYVLNVKDSLIDVKPIHTGELLHHKRWSWMVIERVGNYFLRFWDRENPAIQAFHGYEQYPLTTDYIFEGNFKYYPTPKKEKLQSVLGEEEVEFIGLVSFDFRGQTYSLEVGQDGFTIIGDKTSAIETYGGGRYMYIDLPATDSLAIVDFNFCYNPPCAFSEFTTCLFPPKQNILPFEIFAGEKYSDHE